MTDEINEIIRVLQLTTYDEDEWESDNLTYMKKAQVGQYLFNAIMIIISLYSTYAMNIGV